MLIRAKGASQWERVAIRREAARTIILKTAHREYRCLERLDGYMEGGYGALVDLSAQVEKDGFEIRGCMSCRHFRFSGMSHEFSEGWAGYCSLTKIDGIAKITRIDEMCGEHDLLPVWNSDRGTAQEQRVTLWGESRSASRIAAFTGAIAGLAVGDALGFPAEFRKRKQILDCFGPDGMTGFVALLDRRWVGPPIVLSQPHAPGTYSDDTQMSMAVAEALIESGREDLDQLMNTMARHFVVWSRSADNNRFPGGTCMAGCLNLESGVPWRNAGVAESKGCGSAMRAAPIGLYFWLHQDRLLETARASSLLTHGHDAAIEATAAVALLVALALMKEDPASMYKILLRECAPRSSDFRDCLQRLPSLLEAEPSEALSSRGIGEGWVAEEAVTAALYCFWRSPEDFRQTVLTAANTDGDSDSIACIAGAISGAFNGLNSIPAEWRDQVENAQLLQDVGRRMWETALP